MSYFGGECIMIVMVDLEEIHAADLGSHEM